MEDTFIEIGESELQGKYSVLTFLDEDNVPDDVVLSETELRKLHEAVSARLRTLAGLHV